MGSQITFQWFSMHLLFSKAGFLSKGGGGQNILSFLAGFSMYFVP